MVPQPLYESSSSAEDGRGHLYLSGRSKISSVLREGTDFGKFEIMNEEELHEQIENID
jgi:hypothetical protein